MKKNPDGDIEVKYIGLRPGDKMHEELLISGDIVGTRHPHIMHIKESARIESKELTLALEELEEAMNNEDQKELQNILQRLVEGYRDECLLSIERTRHQEDDKDDRDRPILH